MLTGWQSILQSVKVDQAPSIARASLIIADREGTILARVPDAGDWSGQKLPDWLKPPRPGKPRGWKPLPTRTDEPILTAFVPATSPAGLAVVEFLLLPPLTADIDQATYQDLLAIAGRRPRGHLPGLVRRPPLHLSADGGFAAGGPKMAGGRPERPGVADRCRLGIRRPVAVVQRHGRRAAGAGDGTAAAIQLPRSPGGGAHARTVGKQQPASGRNRRPGEDRGGPAPGAEAAGGGPACRRHRA